jgi:hypothetical protein
MSVIAADISAALTAKSDKNKLTIVTAHQRRPKRHILG